METLEQFNLRKTPTDPLFVLLVVNNRQQRIHTVVSLFYLYWMLNRDIWKTIPIKLKNCFGTSAGWVNIKVFISKRHILSQLSW